MLRLGRGCGILKFPNVFFSWSIQQKDRAQAEMALRYLGEELLSTKTLETAIRVPGCFTAEWRRPLKRAVSGQTKEDQQHNSNLISQDQSNPRGLVSFTAMREKIPEITLVHFNEWGL